MLRKIIILPLLITLLAFGAGKGLEYTGVNVKMTDDQGKVSHVLVKREIPEVCKKVPIDNDMVWTGNYANAKVPEACKSTYVHTTGHLLPVQLHEDIDTYGELEVLAFMKHMQKDSSLLLIDGRKESWFNYRTIPGAIHIPFHHLKEKDAFEFEFDTALVILGVSMDADKSYNFKKAKTLTIFCNGPWCSQSVAMIKALLAIGYPAEKISWYRGGMQNWLAAGMTTTRK
ncbi:MAG: rhodanese-like domain-containing protein [Sulfurovum sp.]|nr:rhodanese-like domain-containing protein [Sulfurovum sp.]